MVIKALLDVSLEGLGKHGRTSIFPCGIFQYSKEINGLPGTPNYDLYQLALKSTAQRLYPNYVNMDWSNQKSWSEYDKEIKEKVLNDLSEEDYNKLLNILLKNPDLLELLGLEIVDD